MKKLEKEDGADGVLEANRHQFDGGQTKLPELLAVCNALPFLDVYRLVVVNGLLAGLDSRSGPANRGSGEPLIIQPLFGRVGRSGLGDTVYAGYHTVVLR